MRPIDKVFLITFVELKGEEKCFSVHLIVHKTRVFVQCVFLPDPTFVSNFATLHVLTVSIQGFVF